MGAGGSTIAADLALMRRERGDDVPGRILVSNRSVPRLEPLERIHRQIDTTVEVRYVHARSPRQRRAGGGVAPGLAGDQRDRDWARMPPDLR